MEGAFLSSKQRKELIMEVYNIWITWLSSTGSKSSYLFCNGNCSLEKAKQCIDGTKRYNLFKFHPSFLKNVVSVEMKAQNIKTGKVFYKKVFV